MNRARHAIVGLSLLVISFTLGVVPGGAHKPITSPFTYNEDVFPILRQRCASCHVPDGVAPMSLMTYEDTVPWGESIRVELLAGHMPPWSVDTAATRFRNVRPLTARDINVLLTWATGGTPLGNPEKTPQPVALERRWSLGTPDLELPMPREFTLPEGKQEDIAEFVVASPFAERRWLRAVDIAPGTPAMVRSATVEIRGTSTAPARVLGADRMVAAWLPGDEAVATDDGTAFELPEGAELLVRVRYKKTWQYERKELRDRSTIGLYFARDGAEPVRALAIGPSAPPASAAPGRQSFTQTIDENVRAVAVYANEHPANAGIVVTAVAPDGARRELIAFHPRRDWSRRYWFNEPIALVGGTMLETTVAIDDERPLPLGPGTPPQAQEAQDQSRVHLTLNVVTSR
jgi:hypothetical protein